MRGGCFPKDFSHFMEDSLNKYLFSAYYLPNPVAGTRNTSVSKTAHMPSGEWKVAMLHGAT